MSSGSVAPRTPDVARIVSLRPDLVIANAEENRAADLEALRAEGCDVWVTDPRRCRMRWHSCARCSRSSALTGRLAR
jgi:ABC-type Fe3+-hydroxamate transport system substrate-binding protein